MPSCGPQLLYPAWPPPLLVIYSFRKQQVPTTWQALLWTVETCSEQKDLSLHGPGQGLNKKHEELCRSREKGVSDAESQDVEREQGGLLGAAVLASWTT